MSGALRKSGAVRSSVVVPGRSAPPVPDQRSDSDTTGRSNVADTVIVRYGVSRPSRGLVPFLTAIVILLAWGGVAHQSGSGWVQVMGVVIGGYAFTGLFVPALACWGLRVQPVSIPADVIAGDDYAVDLCTNFFARVRPLGFSRAGGGDDAGSSRLVAGRCYSRVEPVGQTAGTYSSETTRRSVAVVGESKSIDGMAIRGASSGPLRVPCRLTSLRRGLVNRLEFDVATAWPLGILWWHKKATFDLGYPIHVAPRRGQPLDTDILEGSSGGDLYGMAGRPGSYRGYQRGVRQYVPGDLPRDVHWPASAHAGRLMAREREIQQGQPVLLDVRLSADVDEADLLAERLMGSVDWMIRSGRELVMITLEMEGRICRSVRDITSAGRRLARALPESESSSAASSEMGNSRVVPDAI
ncbi:MAG: DUF58 domain-containing protein [Actinobacteria bacterium]|nr:DUF58 domain-containing protein [Actinomycetota bacterium]